MARKKYNPGCPCCEATFPCTPTDCGDETTSPIRRVTLTLDMPNEIVAIGVPTGGGGQRETYISRGWSTINGTYTFELNLSTCRWSTAHFPDPTGVFVECWRLPSTANCANYLSLIDPDIMIPSISPQYLSGSDVRIDMFTSDFVSKFFHRFQVAVAELGPFFSWGIDKGASGEVCGESPLVFEKIKIGSNDADYVCDGDDALTSKANSYEI